jgi:hypothetical protein
MMEMRFSICTLKKPVVIAPVGKGDNWMKMEVWPPLFNPCSVCPLMKIILPQAGILADRCNPPKVNLQEKADSLPELVDIVKLIISHSSTIQAENKVERRPRDKITNFETLRV